MIVEYICAGQAASLQGGRTSAIRKPPLDGPVRIDKAGVAGDCQVDRRHHGYPAMALHLYPADHYGWLRDTFASPVSLDGPGSMGENLFVHAVDETAIAIGDRYRFGTALVEASQPRQPCATIERHLDRKGVVKAIVETGRCGIFFRVLEEGTAEAGDRLDLVEQGSAAWTIRRAFFAVYGREPGDPGELAELAALPGVSDRLVLDIAKRGSRAP